MELVEEKALDMLQPGFPVISIKKLQAAVNEHILQLAEDKVFDDLNVNDGS